MSRKIAFYAPLKSPNHPTPSGDRTMARGLMNALAEVGDVTLVSEFRSRDGAGDGAVQAALIDGAEAEVARLTEDGTWDAWVTYHNYYKAPDLVGPRVCAALNIPYHLIEASRAKKRLVGPWAGFAARAEAACDAADVIYYFTEHDRFALERDAPADQALVRLKPFLDRLGISDASVREKWSNLLAVGMFRHGDKLNSYTNLARALSLVTSPDWVLDIVGLGKAEPEVRALFAAFGDRVTFHGQLSGSDVVHEMCKSDVFVWPGVNEAFGMVYLEAQASGTPIVAEDRDGVRDVVGPSSKLVPPNDAAAFAAAIDEVLQRPYDPVPHQSYVRENHLIGSAVQVLRDTMTFKKAAA